MNEATERAARVEEAWEDYAHARRSLLDSTRDLAQANTDVASALQKLHDLGELHQDRIIKEA